MGYWEPLSGIHVSRLPRESATSPAPYSRAELGDFIVTWLSHRVRLPASRIDRSRSFADHGLDSMAAVELANALSDKLGKTLDETLLWNFATIDDLLSHLDEEARGAQAAGAEKAPSSRLGAERTETMESGTELDAELARLEVELKRR
jgi:acyl carrier protein